MGSQAAAAAPVRVEARPGGRAPRGALLLIAFAVGAATLGLEVVAARVAALNAGVSLYSWTATIGAVLAGLAAGGAVGGRLADRPAGGAGAGSLDAANRRRLVLLLAGAAAYAPLVVTAASALPVVEALARMPRLGRLGLIAPVVALAPSLLLGATGPLLARLAVASLARSGRAVGGLWAATTLGSLVGVLLAGLLLVPAVGVRGTALAVAALLLAAAAALGRPGRALLAAAAAVVLAGVAARAAPRACDRESAYQCIRVVDDETPDGRPVRTLLLDELPHSDVDPTEPLVVVGDYLNPAVDVAAYVRPVGGPAPAILLIGGGGYGLARYLAAAYPGATIDVLELDPEVTAIARERLGLAPDAPLGIRHGDARQTIEELPPERRYDLAVLDAFSDLVVPYHLTTREFGARVKARLLPGGVYVALVHDRTDAGGRLLPAFARTVVSVFGAVDVLGPWPMERWRARPSRTWSVVGGRAPLDPERFAAVRHAAPGGLFPRLSAVMPRDELAELLGRPGPLVLTDDHAPVELLAPLIRR